LTTSAARSAGDLSGADDGVCFHLLASFSALHACTVVAPAAADQSSALRSLATAAAALVPHCAPLLQHGSGGRSSASSPTFACIYQTGIAIVQLLCIQRLAHLLHSQQAQSGAAELASSLLDAAPGWLPWLSALLAVAREEMELQERGVGSQQSGSNDHATAAATRGTCVRCWTMAASAKPSAAVFCIP
jgi:hypothetical protein